MKGLLEAVVLKEIDRAGWLRVGVVRPESVAGHSWGVALLVLAFLPDELSMERALTFALLHDLPEVRVGDLTPADGVSGLEKAAREHRSMRELAEILPRGPILLAAWEAYEAQEEPEARFVRQLDRLDMAIQALRYAEHGTSEFLSSAEAFITEPTLLRVMAEVLAAMERSDATAVERSQE